MYYYACPHRYVQDNRQKVPDCFFIKNVTFFIWTFYYQKGGHPNGCNHENSLARRGNRRCIASNGAEVYRVEDTVMHILEAYEIENYDVYVLSNGILASANEDREDACSMIRHIPLGTTHLERIVALNQLSREICSYECSLIDA